MGKDKDASPQSHRFSPWSPWRLLRTSEANPWCLCSSCPSCIPGLSGAVPPGSPLLTWSSERESSCSAVLTPPLRVSALTSFFIPALHFSTHTLILYSLHTVDLFFICLLPSGPTALCRKVLMILFTLYLIHHTGWVLGSGSQTLEGLKNVLPFLSCFEQLAGLRGCMYVSSDSCGQRNIGSVVSMGGTN